MDRRDKLTDTTRRRSLFSRLQNRAREILGRAIKCPVGSAFFVFGLSGFNANLASWRWGIDRVTQDEHVLALAERGVAFATWLNQPVVRWALVAVGFILILWRLPWFWRLRHRLIFGWRRLLADQVWIDRAAASNVLRNSTWAELKRPATNPFDGIQIAIGGGLTASQKAQKKFAMFIRLTLDSFTENNPRFVRTNEAGETEYEQGALERFAREAMRAEVMKDFGDIPGFTV